VTIPDSDMTKDIFVSKQQSLSTAQEK